MWGLRRHATAPSLRRSSSLWHQSFSRRAPYRPQNLGLLQYISFYQYTKLEASGLPKLRHQLLADWQRFGVMGRVYIAEEGINAQITVPMTRLDDFKAYLDTLDWLDDALLNLGAVLDHNDATPEGKCPFHTLHVRVRPHLAHDGLDKSLSMDDRGIELSPADWHEALSSPTHKRIFDCRNYYEHDVGRFEGAERIMVDTFKDTWASLDALLDGSPKDTECMIYCTGGIRCEKVGAYLKTNGYTNVKRLQGGIVHYGKFVREHNLSSKFLGRNFVFDQRLSNDDQALSDDVLGQCYQCGAPTNTHVNCANTLCHGLVLQCDACHAAFDGACSSECQRIKHEMDVMATDDRKAFAKTNSHRFQHHVVPNARVRPGNPFHARSYSTYHISEATMSPELNDYIHDVSRIPASDSQLSAWRDAIGRDFSDDLMQKMISPGQAKALQFLVQALSASKVLEVGCFTGYSAVAMALALPHGHVTTCDIDPKAIAWTRAQLATSSISNVTVHAQPGLDLLATTQETFDFAFIDGSKKDYVAVYEALVASDRLLAPKSWIVFDNTLFRGQVVEHAYGRGKPNEKTASQLMDFNKHVASDARTRSVVLPMYDGLTLVQKL